MSDLIEVTVEQWNELFMSMDTRPIATCEHCDRLQAVITLEGRTFCRWDIGKYVHINYTFRRNAN